MGGELPGLWPRAGRSGGAHGGGPAPAPLWTAGAPGWPPEGRRRRAWVGAPSLGRTKHREQRAALAGPGPWLDVAGTPGALTARRRVPAWEPREMLVLRPSGEGATGSVGSLRDAGASQDHQGLSCSLGGWDSQPGASARPRWHGPSGAAVRPPGAAPCPASSGTRVGSVSRGALAGPASPAGGTKSRAPSSRLGDRTPRPSAGLGLTPVQRAEARVAEFSDPPMVESWGAWSQREPLCSPPVGKGCPPLGAVPQPTTGRDSGRHSRLLLHKRGRWPTRPGSRMARGPTDPALAACRWGGRCDKLGAWGPYRGDGLRERPRRGAGGSQGTEGPDGSFDTRLEQSGPGPVPRLPCLPSGS